jgi:hypothetical protein
LRTREKDSKKITQRRPFEAQGKETRSALRFAEKRNTGEKASHRVHRGKSTEVTE